MDHLASRPPPLTGWARMAGFRWRLPCPEHPRPRSLFVLHPPSKKPASALARGILTHEGKPPTLAVSEEADGKDALTSLLENPKVDAVDDELEALRGLGVE